MKIEIKKINKDELIKWLKVNNIKPFYAGQIFKWIYQKQIDSFYAMTDLSKSLREFLDNNFLIERLQIKKIYISNDGSKKYLFILNDGNFIESVLIPEKEHYTLCISSQVGCAQNCAFCATAKCGFIRNLTNGEIISQVRDIKNDLDNPELLTNIVFMGMGEPFANYSNVIKAIDMITDNDIGLKFSARRVTVSTCGIVPFISRFGNDSKANIAISLNASDNNTRNMLMPVNKNYPIEELLESCRLYPLKKRNRITFEYVLIKDINDSINDANRLSKLLKLIKAKINLIPINSNESSQFLRPKEDVIKRFQEILVGNGYTCIVRNSKGNDILAACGQLSIKMGG